MSKNFPAPRKIKDFSVVPNQVALSVASLFQATSALAGIHPNFYYVKTSHNPKVK
jgi:hypothetical protein